MDDLRATHPAAVNDPVRIPPANHDKRQELIRCQTALPCMDANGGAVQMDALQALVAHNDLDRVDASPVLAMMPQRSYPTARANLILGRYATQQSPGSGLVASVVADNVAGSARTFRLTVSDCRG